jgi:L-ribulose-5-phosphate 3-epimerase
MNPIGIMQGRLSLPVEGQIQTFPIDTWRDEFFLARDLGLDGVEWVYDVATYTDNPLLTEAGLTEIRRLRKRSGVEIWSVCADYFRDCPLIRVDSATLAMRLQILRNLISQCRAAGIRRVMIPFVDSASIVTDDDFNQAINALRTILPFARANDLVITLEASLEPGRYRSFLECINNPALRVTFDIGDCASLGHDPTHEIKLLGPWLGVVHVKDRLTGGFTVPLGTGNADFKTVFTTLALMAYSGPFVLQAAREQTGKEIATVRKNILFVKQHLTRLTGLECHSGGLQT